MRRREYLDGAHSRKVKKASWGSVKGGLTRICQGFRGPSMKSVKKAPASEIGDSPYCGSVGSGHTCAPSWGKNLTRIHPFMGRRTLVCSGKTTVG
jgi:hypothetical protein